MESAMAKRPKSPVDEQGTKVRRISNQAQNLPEKLRLKLIMAMVRLGFSIIPVVPYEKKPAVKNWLNVASKDPKKIKTFFLTNASYNYGILTGAASGVFVVDLDGAEGIRSWRRLQKRYGCARRTVTVQSPNGKPLYF